MFPLCPLYLFSRTLLRLLLDAFFLGHPLFLFPLLLKLSSVQPFGDTADDVLAVLFGAHSVNRGACVHVILGKNGRSWKKMLLSFIFCHGVKQVLLPVKIQLKTCSIGLVAI